MESEEQGRRRKGPGHTLGTEVQLRTFFTADAEAQNLRHGNIEFELVGEVGVGREIAVGIDDSVPRATHCGAVVPAVRDSICEEVATAEFAGSRGELLELNVVGEESPLKSAACPQIAFCCGV